MVISKKICNFAPDIGYTYNMGKINCIGKKVSFKGKEGVIMGYDVYGNLHGTWGNTPIHVETDDFIILSQIVIHSTDESEYAIVDKREFEFVQEAFDYYREWVSEISPDITGDIKNEYVLTDKNGVEHYIALTDYTEEKVMNCINEISKLMLKVKQKKLIKDITV